MLSSRGGHDRIRAHVFRIRRTNSFGDCAAPARAHPDEATLRISRARAAASLEAFGATIFHLPRHCAPIPRSCRRSLSDFPHRKRHQLLFICEAAAVLDCPVGLRRRRGRICLLCDSVFCALDLLGPATALYRRIAGQCATREQQAGENAEARYDNDVGPVARLGGVIFWRLMAAHFALEVGASWCCGERSRDGS